MCVTKALLWFLLSAMTAMFVASGVLQVSREQYEAEQRRNGQPSAFYVEIVEPKMRSPHVTYGCERMAHSSTAAMLSTTRPARMTSPVE